uniref:Altered inheritance of mitochondria protein 24, mitochondrial n=2 Tax=Proboscia inermis TaxID=420281 RepID=A0A7S0C9S9_9STRA|mmetsp:Transcript_3597/g.3671  ORF Transcript_3597/g.3671 Transcript_3597/m.3671 type:complete len:145 (+) Transcript_3597:269-703(+)
MEFAKKMTAGFFGGEGFVLQSLTGDGDVFVKAGGTLIRRDLGDGEILRISSGCLVGFSNGVEYDIQMMPGIKNAMFGGEGLFVTTLTGPGTVWLQGQPPSRMISEIASRVPGGGLGLALPIPGMGGGGGGDSEGGEGESEGTST